MSRKWIEQKERSNPFTLKLICWVALHIGRWFARIWLYPITFYFYLTAPQARKASKYYLQRCFPGRKITPLHIAKHIYWFAATVLDRVYFMTDQYDYFEVKIDGLELLEKHIAEGNGCIVLGSHLGSFDVLRCLAIEKYGAPLKIMMYRDHNQMIVKIIDALNPNISKSVINLADDNALLRMKECLEQGELIGMLGDRVAESDKIVSCRLLGDETEFPSGPIRLAGILNVPVILFFGLYQGGNRYHIHFEKLADKIEFTQNNREEVIQAWMEKYVSRIEHHIKLSPYNWFNFYDYWHDE